MQKLGTQTASVINHIMSRSTKGQPDPVVGMGATILHWTDRDAGTITKVFAIGKDLAIEVQQDKATRTDTNGMSEMQTYAYEADPNGARSTWRFKAGAWKQVRYSEDTKRWRLVEAGGGLQIGVRRAYHDFSF